MSHRNSYQLVSHSLDKRQHSYRLDVCIDQTLAQVLSLYQRALHASGCHISTPNPILCALSHTRCGQSYRLRPPLPCPNCPNRLVSFCVLAPSADQADLVNRDMTTDADTWVPNQTLCNLYAYAIAMPLTAPRGPDLLLP